MKCVVTAGPTYEPLDEVRCLTNFSTGRLGSDLANYLAEQGHEVTLLVGSHAIYRGNPQAGRVDTFTTTTDLRFRLKAFAGQNIGAVFHAAAVCDFAFGGVWERTATGELIPCPAPKISTRKGELLAELKPTPKIISELRDWYSGARLVGWKYELEGDRARVISLAEAQMSKNRTDACVVNGAAYGEGFGLVATGGKCEHFADASALYRALAKFIGS